MLAWPTADVLHSVREETNVQLDIVRKAANGASMGLVQTSLASARTASAVYISHDRRMAATRPPYGTTYTQSLLFVP